MIFTLKIQHSPIKLNQTLKLTSLKESFISIINSYNNLYLNMNILNKIIINNSDGEAIKIKIIKEPLNLINKEISRSKTLIESFFKKLNDNINDNSGKSNNVKILFLFQQSNSSLNLNENGGFINSNMKESPSNLDIILIPRKF